MDKQGKLTRAVSISWAVGELGIAAYVGITMSYMLFFLTQALGISPVWAGFALLIPRLWDAGIDPFVGAISDRTKTRMGRRRPFLLFGALTFGVAFAMIFFAPANAPEATKIVYVVALYLLTSTAFTFYDVPYSSMAAEMTTDYGGRTLLTGYKMIAARLGILITILVAPLIFTTSKGLNYGFQLMGVIFGSFMIVTGLIAFFGTKNAPQITRPVERFSLKAEYRALAENRPFLILWSAFLMQNLAIGAAATTLIYYVVFVMHLTPAAVGPLAATGAVSATLATPIWVWIARRLGKRKTYFIGLGIAATMSLPALFIPASMYFLLFPALFLVGIGDAANQLLPNAMVPDTVEYDEHNTGQRREGTIFGTWAFCRKLGMALGAFLVSIFLSFFGFAGGQGATTQSADAIWGIRLAYSLVPFTLWLCTIAIIRYYNLSEHRFDEIKREIVMAREGN